MKKLFYITLGFCFIFAPAIASARVDITSDITESTTWTRDAGPYVIDGEVTLGNGVTVNVDPGTVIKYTFYSKLIINGTLNLNGSDSESVVVTSNRDDEYGGDTNNDEELDYEEPPLIADFEPFSVVSGGSLKVNHVLFRYTGATMINEGGSLNIGRISFFETDWFLWQMSGSTNIENTTIDTMDVVVSSGVFSLKNALFNNRSLHLGGSVVADVYNTIFTSTSRIYTAIGLDNRASLNISSSTISGFKFGISAFGDNRITADFVDIHDNYTGISYDIIQIIGQSLFKKFVRLLVPVVYAEDGPFADISNSSITNNRDFAIYNNLQDFTILAKGNWWGDASGPLLYDYVGDSHNYISENVDASDFLLTPPTGPKIKCCSSVMFLPGIMASRLYVPGAMWTEDQLWEPNNDEDVEGLFLDENGDGLDDNVYTKDVISEANVLPLGQGNIYKSFLSDLADWKEGGVIADYKAIPYDWRLSLDDILDNGHYVDGKIYYTGARGATTSPYIIQELRNLAGKSPKGRVTIVAHSNGGLLTKVLVNKLGAEASNLIDKIIFVAVPQLGTPQAIGVLLHGYKMGIPEKLPIFLEPETSRQFASTSQMAYNLLPSSRYFETVHDPVITFDNSTLLAPWRAMFGDSILSPSVLVPFITGNSRDSLPSNDSLKVPVKGKNNFVLNSIDLHSVIDSWQPPVGVSVVEVAGWGIPTAKTVEYYAGVESRCVSASSTACSFYQDVPILEYKVAETVDGDGTVVAPSALWTASSTRYWVNLFDYDNFFTTERKHADIFEVPSLRTLIKNTVIGTTTPLPEFISTSMPVTATSLPRLRFTLHSPLHLGVFDALGNYTGISTTTGVIIENIPGSRFRQYGELTYVDVPASTTASVVLTGYATSTFTLDVGTLNGLTPATTTTFAGIPTTPTSIIALDVSTDGITPGLRMDTNGDGDIDMLVPSNPGGMLVYNPAQPVVPEQQLNPQQSGSLSSSRSSLRNQATFSLTNQGLVPVSVDTLSNIQELFSSVYNGWTISVLVGVSGGGERALLLMFKRNI